MRRVTTPSAHSAVSTPAAALAARMTEAVSSSSSAPAGRGGRVARTAATAFSSRNALSMRNDVDGSGTLHRFHSSSMSATMACDCVSASLQWRERGIALKAYARPHSRLTAEPDMPECRVPARRQLRMDARASPT